jgi:hypothetical protein
MQLPSGEGKFVAPLILVEMIDIGQSLFAIAAGDIRGYGHTPSTGSETTSRIPATSKKEKYEERCSAQAMDSTDNTAVRALTNFFADVRYRN